MSAERFSLGPDPAPAPRGVTGHLSPAPGNPGGPLGLLDDAVAPVGESLGVAPEVLPLAVPSGRSISAASVVSPGMFERALPSEVRPGPRRQTGNSVGPGSTREPSGRVPGSRRPSLDLAEWKKDRSIVLSVTGEVDIATTPQLSEALAAALRFLAKGLVCDLTGVSFLGASGLTALLLVRRRAVACHTWLDLACPQSCLARSSQ